MTSRLPDVEAAEPRDDRRFRALLDTAANVILALRADHTIFEWNKAAEQLFGVPREAALGRNYVEDFIPQEQRSAVRADIVKVLGGTPTTGFEDDALLPDGTRRTLLWNVTRLLDEAGTPEGILAIGQDVTEWTAAERRFRQMFERSADGLLLVRVPGGVVQSNQAARDMLGVASPDELLNRHVATFSPERQPDGTPSAELSRRMDALAAENGFHRFEWMHLDTAGRPLPVEVSLSHLGTDRGEPLFLVTWHDLRPQKKAEQERAALEARLRQAERLELVGRFAGGIAHDFNNLLTVITANLSGLETDLSAALPHAQELHEQLEDIGQAASRAQALVKELLAFSRQQPMVRQHVVIGQLLRRMEKLLRRVIGEEISLEVSVLNDDAAVFADATQLERVVLNLAVNARDAMVSPHPERSGTGGTLRLRVDQVQLSATDAAPWGGLTPGRWVRLTVSDTGHGMSPETCARVFEPFFTTKDVGRGTGLGLSTVLGIVQQAGGAIRVDSTLGRGTTFTVLLPPSPHEGPLREQAPAALAPRPTRTSTRILLVEDQDAVRETTRRILERAGYRVDVAENGRVALERWRGEGGDYALVLTDVRMPELGGRELAEQLVAMAPELPIVFMTGYSATGVPAGLVKRSATIDKPYQAPELLAVIARFLDTAPGP